MEQTQSSDEVIFRFNRLMQDVIRGDWRRTSFTSWEMELLLDIQSNWDDVATRRDLLVRYQKAVQRQLSRRREMPMTLSMYIDSLRVRQAARTAATESRENLTAALS